jgi:hypothetical protein
MLLTDLLPILKELSPADKQKVIDFLTSELANEETAKLVELGLEPGRTYEIWSPYDAFEAAKKLAKLLKDHQKSNDA